MLVRVLLIADREVLIERLRSTLTPLDVALTASPSRGRFWNRLADPSADLIVVERDCLPDPAPKSVESLRSLPNRPEVIVIWNCEDPQERARLLIGGCFAVLFEGLSDETLRDTIANFIERRRETGLDRLQGQMGVEEARLSDFDSEHPAMVSFLQMVRRVVEPDSSLLILGETGVGKERLARGIHAESPRANGPFIPVNCAAFPETLLDGELFGFEEGAFTGATGARRGYFELAHGGTIFLDEIGDLPRHLQVKLLRVLQERTIHKLGSEESIEIDVRVMAATNRNLEREMAEGRFRSDLFYRLGVVSLEIPPLREYPEDIPRFVDRYLAEFRGRLNRHVTSVSPQAMDVLCRYTWPGNIRELINVVERAMILCEGSELTPADLPVAISGQIPQHLTSAVESAGPAPDGWTERPWKEAREAVLAPYERHYLVEQLKATRGRLVDITERTGISSRALFEMMRRHNLHKEDYRRHRRPRGRATSG